MSATEIKAAITANLDKIDETMLKAIHALTETYIQKQEEKVALEAEINAIPPYEPKEKLSLNEELDKARAEFENGDYLTLEELENEMETW